MYRIFSVVNGADTIRDPDDLLITELYKTDTKVLAFEYVYSYIKNKFFFDKEITPLMKDDRILIENEKWYTIKENDTWWYLKQRCSYGMNIFITCE